MKGSFSTSLFLGEHLIEGKSIEGEWVVLHALVYRDERLWIVPRGFITDLASIPAMLRGPLNVNGSHRRAAVLHDYLYCTRPVSREEADDLFLEAMEAIGVGRVTRTLMWTAVRAFGWRVWNAKEGSTSLSDDFVPPGYFLEGDA